MTALNSELAAGMKCLIADQGFPDHAVSVSIVRTMAMVRTEIEP